MIALYQIRRRQEAREQLVVVQLSQLILNIADFSSLGAQVGVGLLTVDRET